MAPKRMLFLIGLLMILMGGTAWAEPLLIAHSSVAETELSSGDVKRIFLGKKKKWSNGDRINVATLKKGPVHDEFVQELVGKNSASFTSYWKRALVTGTGIPPKSFETEEALIGYVSSTPGAIGYIDKATSHDMVKVLKVK